MHVTPGPRVPRVPRVRSDLSAGRGATPGRASPRGVGAPRPTRPGAAAVRGAATGVYRADGRVPQSLGTGRIGSGRSVARARGAQAASPSVPRRRSRRAYTSRCHVDLGPGGGTGTLARVRRRVRALRGRHTCSAGTTLEVARARFRRGCELAPTNWRFAGTPESDGRHAAPPSAPLIGRGARHSWRSADLSYAHGRAAAHTDTPRPSTTREMCARKYRAARPVRGLFLLPRAGRSPRAGGASCHVPAAPLSACAPSRSRQTLPRANFSACRAKAAESRGSLRA